MRLRCGIECTKGAVPQCMSVTTASGGGERVTVSVYGVWVIYFIGSRAYYQLGENNNVKQFAEGAERRRPREAENRGAG